MRNSAIIQSIGSLLKAYQELSKSDANKIDADSLHYLLGQSIRQYDIPKERWHVSKVAFCLWKELSTDKIEDYHYRNSVVCDNLKAPTTVQSYIGSESIGKERVLNPGEIFIFNEVFHEDHIIPVSFILKELLNLQNVNKETIENCLNKMHMCVLLKEEDRSIGRTKGRENYENTVNIVYKKANIELEY